jgi:methylmalonyl-CoA carboxyltransferase small subunit
LKLQVVIGGETYEVDVEDTEASQPAATEGIQSIVLPGPGSEPQAGADAKIYCSPVAGLVARINVERGQVVQANDVLLVLEAMKMETSIVATTAGKLKCVHVRPGDAVKLNQDLLEFE